MIRVQRASLPLMPRASRTLYILWRSPSVICRLTSVLNASSGLLTDYLEQHLFAFVAPPLDLDAISERQFLTGSRDCEPSFVYRVRGPVRELGEVERVPARLFDGRPHLRPVVQLELPLRAEVHVPDDVNLCFRECLGKIGQELQALAFSVYEPEDGQRSLQLRECLAERPPEVAYARLIARTRIDHHRALWLALHEIHELDPAFTLVKIHELPLDGVPVRLEDVRDRRVRLDQERVRPAEFEKVHERHREE